MILARTLHNFYNHIYLISKGILHDSYRNLSYKKLTLFLQEPYWFLKEPYMILARTLLEPYKILTRILHDFYKNLTRFLQKPYMILTQNFAQSCIVLAWILHGIVFILYDAHTLRKTLYMTRMAFFLRYGRLEAVSVRTSFAKSLQMEVHCYYITEIVNLQIFGHKA